MKRILLIATGGTIASRPSDEGLVPMLTSEELLYYIPELSDICEAETIQLFNLDSTNVYHKHWLEIVLCIQKNYDRFDGFVITHGTDTMAYTAAALSYLIQNSRKPIVITGAQQSIFNRETDARRNLLDAFRFAADERSGGVHLVFDGQVIVGTRARKSRTKSYNAFDSIDYPTVATLLESKLIRYIDDQPKAQLPSFYNAMNPKVFVWKLIPGPDAAILFDLANHYDALVIESFGVGGVPCYDNANFIDGIAEWIKAGKTVVVTTQVPHEGSDLARYQVGYRIKERYEVLEAYSMTLEAVVTKLMWILAQTKDPAEVKRMFYTPVYHDLIG